MRHVLLFFLLVFYKFVSSPISVSSLRKAIKKNELTPYIQPIIDANTKKIIGGEVLLRWMHPVIGIISPSKFIHIAEKSGLLVLITRQLLLKILCIVKKNGAIQSSPFYLSVNINYTHLTDKSFIQDCLSFVEKCRPYNIRLVLELTENESPSLEGEYDGVEVLKNAGVRFALDDFGTGYSTLSALRRFPIDYIKIDKQFSQSVAIDEKSQIIVENTLMLAESLNIPIIVEGVEKKCQARYMESLGAKYLQGYLYSRPVPMSDYFLAS